MIDVFLGLVFGAAAAIAVLGWKLLGLKRRLLAENRFLWKMLMEERAQRNVRSTWLDDVAQAPLVAGPLTREGMEQAFGNLERQARTVPLEVHQRIGVDWAGEPDRTETLVVLPSGERITYQEFVRRNAGAEQPGQIRGTVRIPMPTDGEPLHQ